MLKVKNLSHQTKNPFFSDISFEIAGGSTFAMIGHSGSGKTSIANAILGQFPPDKISGEIQINAGIKNFNIGYIPQDPHASLNPVFKIGQQIDALLKLTSHSKSDSKPSSSKAASEEVFSLLKLMGLEDSILRKYPYQLSGGMKQKVLILMAAIHHPHLIIADEPTSSIDTIFKKEIMDILMSIKKYSNSSIFLITHDMNIAEKYSDFIGVLSKGKLVEIGPTKKIIESPQHPATLEIARARIQLKDIGVAIG